MADQAKEEEVEISQPKSKLVPALLILNTFMVVGVLAFTLLKKPAPAPAAAAASEEHAEAPAEGGEGAANGAPTNRIGPTVRLDDFVVQLKAVESERYAHLGIEIELSGDKEKDVVANYLPKIRDAVIAYLADRTADELRGSQGMLTLKEDLLANIQKVVPGRRVVALYVTNFIVQ